MNPIFAKASAGAAGIKQREVGWLLKEKYSGQKTREFEKDVERLRRGEHISYVIGFVEFLGIKIDLSMRPMIPRPETEFWVNEAINELQGRHDDLRILDAFSGSGCIGISLLRHISNSSAEFLEKEPRLLAQIEKNLGMNGIEKSRARVLPSDVFSSASGTYDAILANPPYVNEGGLTEEEWRELSVEPREAMYAPDKGFFYIERVLCESLKFLKSEGLLYCEIKEDRGSRALEFRNLYREFEVRSDQYGKPRYIRAVC